MATSLMPQVRELDQRDVKSILVRNYVGRLAFGAHDRIEIRPIHYVYSDGRIYGRTSYGAKFERFEILPAPVAFEVDEVESMFRWRSVIAHGTLTVLTPDADAREWGEAVQLLRRLVRAAFTDDDPVPQRSLVFRITLDEVSGRAMG